MGRLPPGRVALEDGAQRQLPVAVASAGADGGGGAPEVVALLDWRRAGGGWGGAVQDAAAGVELLDEHGLDDEAQGEAGVLDEVDEDVVGELGAVDVVADPARLLLRQLPLMVLRSSDSTHT